MKRGQLAAFVLALGAIAVVGYWLERRSSREGVVSGIDIPMAGESPNSSADELPKSPRLASNGSVSPRTGPRRAYSLSESVFPPEGDAAQAIEKLKPLALAGDARAAFLIFLKLHECARLPDAKAQAVLADMSERAGASRGALHSSHERRKLECASVTGSLTDRGRWLEMAAAAGDEQAQLLYASAPEAVLGGSVQMLKDPEKTVQYKATALRYLNDLASRGSTDAMMRLAGAYEGGIIVTPDPVKAYAYYLVVDRAKPGVISSYLMDSQLAKVPPGRVGEARDLARRIYASCCSN